MNLFAFGLAVGATVIGFGWWVHWRTYTGAKSDIQDAINEIKKLLGKA